MLLLNGAAAIVDGRDGVKQRIFIHLRTFRGEWFLDLRAGVPYFDRVLIRGANEADLFAIFNDAIQNRPGVASVDDLTVDFGDSDNRTLTVTGSATSEFGDVPISVEVSSGT